MSSRTEYMRELFARYKAEGRCRRCPNRVARFGGIHCRECAAKVAAEQRAFYALRKTARETIAKKPERKSPVEREMLAPPDPREKPGARYDDRIATGIDLAAGTPLGLELQGDDLARYLEIRKAPVDGSVLTYRAKEQGR